MRRRGESGLLMLFLGVAALTTLIFAGTGMAIKAVTKKCDCPGAQDRLDSNTATAADMDCLQATTDCQAKAAAVMAAASGLVTDLTPANGKVPEVVVAATQNILIPKAIAVEQGNAGCNPVLCPPPKPPCTPPPTCP